MNTNWTCPKCSANNSSRRTTCRVCGRDRAAKQPLSGLSPSSRRLPLLLVSVFVLLFIVGIIGVSAVWVYKNGLTLPFFRSQGSSDSTGGQSKQVLPVATAQIARSPQHTATPRSVTGAALVVPSQTSDASGQAIFEIPDTRQAVTVQALDAETHQPLPGIDLTVATDGSKLLVLASDPTNRYLPGSEQFDSLTGIATPLAILLKEWSSMKTYQDLLDRFHMSDTFYKSLNLNYKDSCIQPESYLNDRALSGLPPALLRVRTFDLNPASAPFNQMNWVAGFCLEPLDRTDPKSIVAWVDYGLSHPELKSWVFSLLAPDTGPGNTMIYGGYAMGGSGSLLVSQFQEEVRARSNATCAGYYIQETELLVFTKDWTPPWSLGNIPPARWLGLGFHILSGDQTYVLDTLLPDPAETDKTSQWYQGFLQSIVDKSVPCSGGVPTLPKAEPRASSPEQIVQQVREGLKASSPDLLKPLMADQLFTGMSCCSDWVLAEQHWESRDAILAMIRADWNDSQLNGGDPPPTCLGYTPLQERQDLKQRYQKTTYHSLAVYLSNHTSFVFTDGLSTDGQLLMTEYYHHPEDLAPPPSLLNCPSGPG